MTFPSILFGLLVAVFLGAAFHFWRGGDRQRLILYLALAQVGFWGGHFIAGYLGWTFLTVGPLYLGMSIVGAVGVMLLTELLMRIDLSSES